jgi:hypothetical protein
MINNCVAWMKRSVIREDWQHRELIPDYVSLHPGYDTGFSIEAFGNDEVINESRVQ